MANACIYCNQTDIGFCKAHILPRSLGKFKNQPTLLKKVCAECDNIIGNYEDHFTHNGLAALLRPKIGLTKSKKRSPFRRGHVGHGPIDMTTNYLGVNGVLLEPDGIKTGDLTPGIPIPQIHFVYSNGTQKTIRINPELLCRKALKTP